jgi:hypothetical protein
MTRGLMIGVRPRPFEPERRQVAELRILRDAGGGPNLQP